MPDKIGVHKTDRQPADIGSNSFNRLHRVQSLQKIKRTAGLILSYPRERSDDLQSAWAARLQPDSLGKKFPSHRPLRNHQDLAGLEIARF